MTLKRKIALVDLRRQTIAVEPIAGDLRERFLGGRGLGSYLLWVHGTKTGDPFGGDNTVVVNAGLLGGTLAADDTYGSILTKSPLTGFYACSTLKGPFAAEMRWAGIDHLVIRGKSPKPVLLYVFNGNIEIKDAGSLWGQSPGETRKKIYQQFNDHELKICAIGPAGENRVHYATLNVDRYGDIGPAGLGAVLGAKKVKALVCRGTGDLEVKHPDQCLMAIPEMAKHRPDASFATPGLFIDSMQSKNMPDEIKAVAMQAGMDTHTLHAMIQWAVKLYAEGVIDRRHTRGLALAKSDMGSLVAMASSIAQRRNLGRLMGESPLRAASKLGRQHLSLFPSLEALLKIYGYDLTMEVDRQSSQIDKQSKRWKPFKGTGIVPLGQLYKLIADCLGIGHPFESEKDIRDIQVPHLSELLSVNTGLTLGTQDLLVIAYRVWALERLFNIMAASGYRRQKTDELNLDVSAAGRLPVNEIDLRSVNKIRQMTDRHFRANGWGPQEAIKKRVFAAIGIGDLWYRKNA